MPGLYFVGAVAANPFGPVLRFARGTEICSPPGMTRKPSDILGPFVDGDAILDGILRRSRSAGGVCDSA
jgi:hypothetical protein